MMFICLSWSCPGLLLHPPGSGEVRGLRRRMHQQHWLTGLGLSSGTSLVASISRYQLRIEDLTLNLSRPRLSWHWAGGGQARGGTQEGAGRWRSGHQIQTRGTEAAWPAEVPAQLPGRRHRHHRCLAWEQEPPPTHRQAQGQAAKATISLQSSSSISTSTAVIPPEWRNICSFIFYSSFIDLLSNF